MSAFRWQAATNSKAAPAANDPKRKFLLNCLVVATQGVAGEVDLVACMLREDHIELALGSAPAFDSNLNLRIRNAARARSAEQT